MLGDGGDGVGLPEDNAQSKGVNDGTNSVVDVAIRWPEAGRRDACGKLDHVHLVTLYHQSALGHKWDGELTVFHISAKACSLGMVVM